MTLNVTFYNPIANNEWFKLCHCERPSGSEAICFMTQIVTFYNK